MSYELYAIATVRYVDNETKSIAEYVGSLDLRDAIDEWMYVAPHGENGGMATREACEKIIGDEDYHKSCGYGYELVPFAREVLRYINGDWAVWWAVNW